MRRCRYFRLLGAESMIPNDDCFATYTHERTIVPMKYHLHDSSLISNVGLSSFLLLYSHPLYFPKMRFAIKRRRRFDFFTISFDIISSSTISVAPLIGASFHSSSYFFPQLYKDPFMNISEHINQCSNGQLAHNQHYNMMDEFTIFKILDICYNLRDSIDEIQQYHKHVELALFVLDNANYTGGTHLRRAQNELHKCKFDQLESKSNIKCSTRRKLEHFISIMKKGPILQGHKNFGERKNVLIKDQDLDSKRNFVMIKYLGQWMSMFTLSSILSSGRRFQRHKTKAKGSPNALLTEWKHTKVIVRSLQAKIDEILNITTKKTRASSTITLHHALNPGLRELSESLRVCCWGLTSSLSTLKSHVENIIKALITKRMVLLEVHSHYKQEQYTFCNITS